MRTLRTVRRWLRRIIPDAASHGKDNALKGARMPASTARPKTVVLKSGIKRAIRIDRDRLRAGRKPFAVHTLDGPNRGKVFYYAQVDILGLAYFVNRPSEKIKRGDGVFVQAYLVSTAPLRCHRNVAK